MSQGTVFNGNNSSGDLINLDPNRHHGIAETIKFSFGFTFGRFNHQSTGDGETHRWRMETMIHQTLCHVVHRYPKISGDPAHINNAFVGNESVSAGIQNGEVGIKTTRYIIRVHNRHLS